MGKHSKPQEGDTVQEAGLGQPSDLVPSAGLGQATDSAYAAGSAQADASAPAALHKAEPGAFQEAGLGQPVAKPSAEEVAQTGAAPLVSILVPVYNMQIYLAQCLNALMAQTLADIEIICIDDGSSDASPVILKSFAERDKRIRVITKENSGYGASMNVGLAHARGHYVGIIEPDDYPDRVMFQKLYKTATRFACDIVKCNYYQHFEDHEDIHWNLHGLRYNTPFDPADLPQVVCTAPAIWTGLYRRAFLEEADIRFRETPGAAFQDASFSLKTWFAARCCVLLRRPMLHYRMDNPGSSSKTADKVFTVCDEMDCAYEFLSRYPDRKQAFAGWFNVGKWGKYRWNYDRIRSDLHADFARRMYDEYTAAQIAGELDLALFDETSRTQLEQLLGEGGEKFAARYPLGYPADWEVKNQKGKSPFAFMKALKDGSPSAEQGEKETNPKASFPFEFKAQEKEGAPLAQTRIAPEDVPEGPSPAVTVVVPVFNCEPYVVQCIDSLKAQTYGDFQAIVVDDASTDGSLGAARRAIGNDNRFTVVAREQNEGLSAVRNVALDQAKGEYIVFLDSDDYLVDDALAKLVYRARIQNLDDLYFSALSFYDSLSLTEMMGEDFSRRPSFEGVATGRELFVYFEEREQFFTQAALRMVRRQFIEDEGIRFKEGILNEDILFTFQTLVASKRSSFLNEPLYMRRLRAGSIIGTKWTVRHIHGHFVSMQAIKSWLHENAASVDDAFLAAVGHRMGIWREVCAHAWANDIDVTEREAYVASLSDADRVDFFNDIVGSGGAADRVRDEYLASITYRVGDALLGVPRIVRNRAQALAVRRNMGR